MKNASVPPIPTAAIASATAPNAPTRSALSRCGATVSCRICSSVAIRSTGWSGISSWISRAAAGPRFSAPRARITTAPGKNPISFCASG
ncbi:MAG TPA: hypothetical protein VJ794_08060, partial [Gemmatimonadales bacterium]|nr:hypothetical protein [Gemmatimonadales bacterium]